MGPARRGADRWGIPRAAALSLPCASEESKSRLELMGDLGPPRAPSPLHSAIGSAITGTPPARGARGLKEVASACQAQVPLAEASGAAWWPVRAAGGSTSGVRAEPGGIFAGVLGVGLYPLMGTRVWCCLAHR